MIGRRARRQQDIWPGFVDALATLVMVVTFLVMVFALAQFFLGQALTGRDEALSRLGRQIAELTDLLDLERRANEELRGNVAQLTAALTAANSDRERLQARLGETGMLTDQLLADKEQAQDRLRQLALLQQDVDALKALRAELEARVAELGAKLGEAEGQLAEERKLSDEARAHAALLNQQLQALRDELSRISALLEESEAKSRAQDVQIADLGRRLNAALASKVEELSKYRSEFFGRLRKVLGNKPGIRIEGDRFVFQSELLFGTGSAEIAPEGQTQIADLAKTLLDLAREIPPDVNWVLRVDGHTDKVPINTFRFPSNWELSTARAISVIRFLIAQGVPADRLAAAGFGEYQPLVQGETSEAYARNRRIELRLDQR